MRNLKLIPLYLAYLSVFGQAAVSKWLGGGVPDWFTKQFASTFLNAFSGALAANFYFIATMESLVSLCLLVSLARLEFLEARARPWLYAGLWGAQLIFVALGFGLRVTGDFNGAANLFFYFGLTWLLWFSLQGLNQRKREQA